MSETETERSDPNDADEKLSQALLWEAEEQHQADLKRGDEALRVDVDGFEGPLDLLLKLARDQKVDLSRISILALAEQYLAFIHEARKMRIEIAADYLVMAAWLAYLKSRLLLPELDDGSDEPTGDELAAALAFRLRRLEAMREAGKQLLQRPRNGLDVFARGDPEPMVDTGSPKYLATVYDLLTAYASQRQRNLVTRVQVKKRNVWSLQEAKDLLNRLLGSVVDWAPIDDYLVQFLVSPDQRATVRASSFSASLEMVREGVIELRQAGPFAPLFVRRSPNSNTSSDQ